MLARDEIVDHARLQRTRSEQRDQRDDVFECVRLQFLDRDRCMPRDSSWKIAAVLAALEQRVRCRVVGRQRGDVERLKSRTARRLLIAFTAQSMIVSVRRPEEIELDETDRFDVVLVELRDESFAAPFGEERREIAELGRAR